ncbi:MAG: glycoside hydrolase family 3 C-terminal domain-containing protein, partial [Spirochaetaceae bacterium]|nr:glycoside hydrolase family 3 C-terminal domain-containing protein [Spirochaetaceae bacterium]
AALDEIQDFIMKAGRWHIPALIHVEAVSGAMICGAATFPSAIAHASTWHPELIAEMGDLIRRQTRALGYRHVLSPVFDICRDPRWGRLSETYGEDETLAAAMACAFVRGVQGGRDEEGVAATGKHFVGHGYTEGGLNMGQSSITERELLEVHCKPFQAAITEEKLMSVMNSYCTINREPVISSRRILTELLRDELGFDGLLVSDYYALERLINPYQVADNHVDAGILAIQAGMDVECPERLCYTDKLIDAVEQGRLDPVLIDRSAARVLHVKFRLGIFEKPFSNRENIKAYFKKGIGEDINRKIAGESITLLKNSGKVLPLDKKIRKLAVVGPHADRVRSLFGSYTVAASIDSAEDKKNNGRTRNRPKALMADGVEVDTIAFYQTLPGEIRETPVYVEDRIRKVYPGIKSFYQALENYLQDTEVVCAQGISYTGNNLSGYKEALDLAADADMVILTLGGQNGWGAVSTIGEGIDNSDIGLPGRQEKFARDIFKLNKKTVVVHIDGRPLSSEYVVSHFNAIIEAWQLGQYGFEELTKAIFGEINPGGKLPVTAARNGDRVPCYYGSPRGSGYTGAGTYGQMNTLYGYINATAYPLFYFGHGLSYTEFSYSGLSIQNKKPQASEALEFSVDVTNSGAYDGDEVVEVYVSDTFASVVRPDKQLIAFKRVPLKKGETKTARFKVPVSQLAFLDNSMEWNVEGGEMKLLIGSSCNDIRISGSFEISGDQKIDPKTRAFYTLGEA